jgi:TPR repeat protein
MNLKNPDWNALQFDCVHEEDRGRIGNEEAKALYEQSRVLYHRGTKDDSEEDIKASFTLALKAAQQGHVRAMNNVVVAYLEGDGVQQSDSKAVDWAEKMIQLESGRGYYHMGVFLEQGIGVKQNREKALAYFRRAADLGNAQGQFAAGKALMTAFDREASLRARGYPIVQAMLRCALQQGLAKSGYLLGQHLSFEGDMPAALRAYQDAGKLGHDLSLWALHSLFDKGATGLEPDPARAERYAELSDQASADKSKRFPNLDEICPLPPAPLPPL